MLISCTTNSSADSRHTYSEAALNCTEHAVLTTLRNGATKDAMSPTGTAARLGSSLHVKGEISGNEDLFIDGTVEGAVQLGEGKLTVGAATNVTADIIAREVVCGERWGNVHAKGRIEIKNDGSVNGDLTTPQIMIEDGAYFKGSIEIERTAETEAGKKISSGTQSAAPTVTAARAEPKSLST